jgi:hypothetical protein
MTRRLSRNNRVVPAGIPNLVVSACAGLGSRLKGRSVDVLRGLIVGREGGQQQLTDLEKAGLQRVILQWLDLEDLQGLTALAKAVL